MHLSTNSGMVITAELVASRGCLPGYSLPSGRSVDALGREVACAIVYKIATDKYISPACLMRERERIERFNFNPHQNNGAAVELFT